MSLLITVVGVSAGIAYARFVGRRLGPRDWRRWIALTPFWALAVGVGLALHTVNVMDPAPRAIQAFAVGSFGEALLGSLRSLRRRRAGESTTRDERAAPLTDASS